MTRPTASRAPAMQVIQDRAQTAGWEFSLGAGRQWVTDGGGVWQWADGGGRKREARGNPGWGAGFGGGFLGSDGGGEGSIHAARPEGEGELCSRSLRPVSAWGYKQR